MTFSYLHISLEDAVRECQKIITSIIMLKHVTLPFANYWFQRVALTGCISASHPGLHRVLVQVGTLKILCEAIFWGTSMRWKPPSRGSRTSSRGSCHRRTHRLVSYVFAVEYLVFLKRIVRTTPVINHEKLLLAVSRQEPNSRFVCRFHWHNVVTTIIMSYRKTE